MRPSWSERLRALVDEDNPADALRAARGRAYQRSGRVTDLRTAPGLLSARVQGSRATPYLVEVGMPVLDDREWGIVVHTVAQQARHAARLLACQAPEGLETELEAQGIRLFPHPAELSTSCGCDDPSPTCKHVVAGAEATARRLDDDPFLLLHLRGRGRERFLADLATARAGGDGAERGLPLSALAGADWTRPRAPLEDVHTLRSAPLEDVHTLRSAPLEDVHTLRSAPLGDVHTLRSAPLGEVHTLRSAPLGEVHTLRSAPLEDVHTLRSAPLEAQRETHGGADPLTRLGDPPDWAGGVSAADLLGPLVDRGAAWAKQQLAPKR